MKTHTTDQAGDAGEQQQLPNPAQLRAMARPVTDQPKPCVPGRHCERRKQNLGGCVAGYCNPPATQHQGKEA